MISSKVKQIVLSLRLALVLMPVIMNAEEPSDASSRIRRHVPELESARQMILVISESWDAQAATLRTFERDDAGTAWREVREKIPAIIGRNGLAWGVGAHGRCDSGARFKQEGDGRSPAGIFGLGPAFGYATARESGVSKTTYLPLTATTRWVDDSASRYYNRFVDLQRGEAGKDWNSAEEMLREDGLYRWGAFVEHNTDGTPGLGSCIFMHIWKADRAGTSGCTSMAPERIEEIVHWLDAAKHPVLVQLPASEYERWRPVWMLPDR
jgi:L,D-peptidoglycan transpeptidase YkuD (ErfK/YbiS/YcfS/YnhG family)